MNQLVACTIVAHNYLPLARLVARSFLEHHPGGRFVVVFVDRPVEARSMSGECFDVLPVTDIDFGPEGFAHMATGYGVTEFATAVKPFALRHLVREAECVLYLDPDIYVYAPLDPLVAATKAAGWSLTPHCLQPIRRDGTGPTEAEIMAAGVYNLGYIGVTPRAGAFLDWWAERLRRDALIDPSNQLFTDQRWIDLAVPVFSPHIERSPAYNVAYWNLDQRDLWRDGDVVMVGDERLRFFHFSGYDPKMPHWLSKYQPVRPRSLMSEHPVLVELCEAYAAELATSGPSGSEVASYGWSEAFPGFDLRPGIRRMFHREMLEADETGGELPPSPFVPGGAARFREWLVGVPAHDERGIPRYLSVLWDERSDLRAAYPGVPQGRAEEFGHWVRTSGRAESRWIDLLADTTALADSYEVEVVDTGRANHGVDVLGYFHAELGVGEAGRLAVAALDAARIPHHTIASKATMSRQQHHFRDGGCAGFDTLLMAINADQFGNVRHQFGGPFFDGRYVIGQWFWEVEQFPEVMHGAYQMVHEIWVATEHVRRAIAEHAPPDVPVLTMPLPLVAPDVAPGRDKRSFELEERFTFLFTFDFLSVLERKNPMAVIEAFRRAFPRADGPQLVLKTINGERKLQDLERVRWAAAGRDDIVVLDGYLSTAEAAALTACCDCYVSLHRAEGLGLTMSEAMALGKPVIATGYSGNVDFMDEQTAYLVPWTPTRIGKGAAPYPPGACWAEPDEEAAVELMRRVVDHPTEAAAIGLAAQRRLAEQFSPAACGARMAERLEIIWSKPPT